MPDFTAPGVASDVDDSPRGRLDVSNAARLPAGVDLDDVRHPPADDLALIGDELDDLSALREELAVDEVPDADSDLTTVIDVPRRPGYAIRCRLDFTGRDVENLRRQSKDKRFADNLDGVKLSSLMLGLTCTAILRHGKPVLNDGEPVTFQTAAFRELYRRDGDPATPIVDDAVRRFFVLEGHVESDARRLTVEAGWSEDLSPTE